MKESNDVTLLKQRLRAVLTTGEVFKDRTDKLFAWVWVTLGLQTATLIAVIIID